MRARAQVIDLGDTLDFTPLPGARRDELTCDMPGVPTDGSNLVVKARRLCVPAHATRLRRTAALYDSCLCMKLACMRLACVKLASMRFACLNLAPVCTS